MAIAICAWPDITQGSIPILVASKWVTSQALNQPKHIAKELGVPVVVCNMGGEFQTRDPFFRIPYRSPFVDFTALFTPDGFRTHGAEDDAPFMVDVPMTTRVVRPAGFAGSA